MTSPLDLVKLTPLMELTSGRSELKVGLIDGPIFMNHPDLMSRNIHQVPGKSGACTKASSIACLHGTFVAGILSAKRNSMAPAVCPSCTLLVHPIFAETVQEGAHMPSATPNELASAIVECIDNGARVLNLSVALARPSSNGERILEEALDYAAKHGIIIVAATGNQGAVGSSSIIRHPWVIPVAASDNKGRPISLSNLEVPLESEVFARLVRTSPASEQTKNHSH
jgi:subtilisin family serine protease